MGKYRIKHWGKQEVELFGGQHYWSEQNEEQAADLDLEEIAKLNQLPPKIRPRRLPAPQSWAITVLLLLLFISLLALEALPFLHMPDLSFLTRSAELYKDDALTSLKSAVVSIEGSRASGSGFNLRPDGLIVSNRHVVENNPATMVIFPDGSRYPAKGWQFIEGYDLALADINGSELPHVVLGDTLPQQGDELIFIGNPLGFDWTISEATMLETLSYEEETVLYFAGQVRSGSSGSPLFNRQGQVIGVIFATMRDVQDIGLAIPAQLLLSYAEQEDVAQE